MPSKSARSKESCDGVRTTKRAGSSASLRYRNTTRRCPTASSWSGVLYKVMGQELHVIEIIDPRRLQGELP
jgi:hypothetical protein